MDKEDVICYCTKCETYHTVSMRWLGHGTPRKYCRHCRNTADVQHNCGETIHALGTKTRIQVESACLRNLKGFSVGETL